MSSEEENEFNRKSNFQRLACRDYNLGHLELKHAIKTADEGIQQTLMKVMEQYNKLHGLAFASARRELDLKVETKRVEKETKTNTLRAKKASNKSVTLTKQIKELIVERENLFQKTKDGQAEKEALMLREREMANEVRENEVKVFKQRKENEQLVESELKQLRSQIIFLKKDEQNLQVQQDQQDANIVDLKEKIDALKNKLEEQVSTLTVLNKAVKESEQVPIRLKAQIDTLKEVKVSLLNENSKAKNKLNELKRANASVEAQNVTAENDLKKLKGRYSLENEALVKHQISLKLLQEIHQKKKIDLEDSLHTLKQTQEDHKRTLSELRLKALALQRENKGIEAKRSQIRKNEMNEKKLEQQNSELKKNNTQVEKKLTLVQNDIKAANSQLNDYEKIIEERLFAVLESEKTEKSFIAKVEQVLRSIAAKRASLERWKIEELNQLKQKKSLQNALQIVLTKKRKLCSRIYQLKSRNETKRLNIRDIQKLKEDKKKALKDCSISYERLKSERNKYIKNIEKANEESAELFVKNRALERESTMLKSSLTHKEKIAHDLLLAVNSHENKRDALLVELNRHKASVQESKVVFKTIRTQNDLQRMKLKQLMRKMKHLNEMMKYNLTRRNELGLAIVDFKEEIVVMNDKVNALEREKREIKNLTNGKIDEERALKILLNNAEHQQISFNKTSARMVLYELKCKQMAKKLKESELEVKMLSSQLESPEVRKENIRLIQVSKPNLDECNTKLVILKKRLAAIRKQTLDAEVQLTETTNVLEANKHQFEEQKKTQSERKVFLTKIMFQYNKINKSLMANIAELAMVEAINAVLQSTLIEKRKSLSLLSDSSPLSTKSEKINRLWKGWKKNKLLEVEQSYGFTIKLKERFVEGKVAWDMNLTQVPVEENKTVNRKGFKPNNPSANLRFYKQKQNKTT